jgi:nucleotide-binding universal stress UspA family protein
MVDKAEAGSGVPTKIVVGTDGSETAGRAVAKAVALAGALGSGLIIVSAYSSRGPSGVPGAGVSIDSGWVAAAHSVAETTAEEAATAARDAGVADVTALAVSGDPAEALIKVTVDEAADLLVVGSKGMQSTARFLLGPIANKVSRRVPCDLLIVETSA